MSTEMITALFAGLVSMLTAIGSIAAQRAKSNGASRRELRELRTSLNAAEEWIYKLERGYKRKGLALPAGKPEELIGNDDDDDGDGSRPPARTPARA